MIGASRLRTMLFVTLPLVAPGVLGATIYVFAEMLGSFTAALVLGLPNRFYVVTTAIYQLVSQYPPRIPLAAAMGVSLFARDVRDDVHLPPHRHVAQLRHRHRQGVPAAARWTWAGCAGCCSASAPSTCCCRWCCRWLTLIYASLQKIAVAFPAAANWTLANYRGALTMNAVRSALSNSLLLGLATATHRHAADGAAVLDRLPLAPAGPRRDRVCRHVPAGGAAAGVRFRHDVGLAGHSAADLRHDLAAADRLPDGVPAAGHAHDLRRDAAIRQDAGGIARRCAARPGSIGCAR